MRGVVHGFIQAKSLFTITRRHDLISFSLEKLSRISGRPRDSSSYPFSMESEFLFLFPVVPDTPS